MEEPCDEYGGAKPDWAAKITLCHGPLVVVADEVVQRRHGSPHLKRTWWTEESIGTASGLWLQTGADSELLLPIVLSRTEGS